MQPNTCAHTEARGLAAPAAERGRAAKCGELQRIGGAAEPAQIPPDDSGHVLPVMSRARHCQLFCWQRGHDRRRPGRKRANPYARRPSRVRTRRPPRMPAGARSSPDAGDGSATSREIAPSRGPAGRTIGPASGASRRGRGGRRDREPDARASRGEVRGEGEVDSRVVHAGADPGGRGPREAEDAATARADQACRRGRGDCGCCGGSPGSVLRPTGLWGQAPVRSPEGVWFLGALARLC